MMEMSCARVKRDELVEAYLLGTLDEDVQEAYELHLFDCPECLDDLETLRALRYELAGTRKDIEAAAAVRRLRPTSAWVLGLAAAVVVIGATALLVGPLVSPTPTRVVTAELGELARVEPAPYTPVTLRGATDNASAAFEDAMGHYLAGDYDDSAEGLRIASNLDSGAPKIGFYLGVSLLLAGETDAAIGSLRHTIALGDTLYLEMAHFYLSRAYVISGEVEAARDELRKTRDLEGDLETEAERLLGLLPQPGEPP